MSFTAASIKKLELWLVVSLILFGAFLRLYRFRETLVFQGDQGRDALIAKQIIKDGNLTLIGPVMSVGNVYLGPVYYYFMAPFLALTYPDPIGPAYGVALVNIGLLLVIYLMTKEMFGKLTGLITLFIYALMIPAIYLSRFSWNPNLAPMIGALIIWCLYRFYAKKQYRKLLWMGLLLGILAQLHYLAMVIIGGVVVVWGMVYKKETRDRRQILNVGLGAGFIFILTFLPLMIFNLRHDNLILQTFFKFLFSKEQHFIPQGSVITTIKEMDGKSIRLFGQTITGDENFLNRILTFGGFIILTVIIFLDRKRIILKDKGFQIFVLVLAFSILGISIYSGTIYDHYLGFALPAVAIFWGYVLTKIIRLNWRVGGFGVGILLILYMGNSLKLAPAFAVPGPPIALYQMVANDIYAQLGLGKYNIAVLTESKDYMGMNYRYFLGVTNRPPANYDDYNNLDKLVVIDELGVLNPLNVQIFEIQQPSLTRLINQFDIPKGPTVYIYGK